MVKYIIQYMPYIIGSGSLLIGLTTITAQLTSSLVVLNDLKGSGALTMWLIGGIGLFLTSFLDRIKFADPRLKNALATTQILLGISALGLIGVGLHGYNTYIPPRVIAVQEAAAKLKAKQLAKLRAEETLKAEKAKRKELRKKRVRQIKKAAEDVTEQVNEVYEGLSDSSKVIIGLFIITGLAVVLTGIYVDAGGGGGGLKSVGKTILAMGTAGIAGFLGGGPAGAVAAAGAAAGGASAWYSINWGWVAVGIGLVVTGLALWWYWGPVTAAVLAHKATLAAAGTAVAKKAARDGISRTAKYGGMCAEGAIGLTMSLVGYACTQMKKAWDKNEEPPLNE